VWSPAFGEAGPHRTASADRRRVLAEQVPGVSAYDSLADLAREADASGGIDAVTITTPPSVCARCLSATRVSLCLLRAACFGDVVSEY
jgi:hypothetical protein